jgi:hypothetical protein
MTLKDDSLRDLLDEYNCFIHSRLADVKLA